MSSTVLAVGLPGGDATPILRWLGGCRTANEPVVLTLANLRRGPLPPLPAAGRIYLVETRR